MTRKRIVLCASLMLVIGLVAATGAAQSAAQGMLTPTVPVKTQVWLDLTATNAATTPTATLTPTQPNTPNYTATYQQEFDWALLTVTAQNMYWQQSTQYAAVLSPTEMERVVGGTFWMGTTTEEAMQALDNCTLYGHTCDDFEWVRDSMPQHEVTLYSFEMEEYEVTVGQYVAFLNALGPNSHLDGCLGMPCAITQQESDTSTITFDNQIYGILNADFYRRHPATMVTWYGAQAYCQFIGRRLPTEAEWEHAARGPEDQIYPWGDTFDETYANTAIPEAMGTVPVNDYWDGVSPYGIYNLAGNVSEWTADWYNGYWYGLQADARVVNPAGPADGREKVLRGGAWDTIPLFVRSVHRTSANPSLASPAIGFRCVSGGGITLPTATPTIPPTATFTPTRTISATREATPTTQDD
ncbi:MAG TPA: SUMF1/EgtB/PvdO family nonheme iron enzyme [Aggregatilineaceae bacterium]|nr:SUMF1/EgtB/PvdO family nonheme iron enzyme [Aggregatilineaceae bacterium]